jgi:hypothetical protein
MIFVKEGIRFERMQLSKKRSGIMNSMEKYLAAIEAAVEVRDKKAIELLDGFSAYVYQEIHSRLNESSGKDRVVWEGMLQRVKAAISGMSESSPGIWD